MTPGNDINLLKEENARLKRLLDERDEEIIQLREMLRPPEWAPPTEIALTKHEARIVASMFKANGDSVSKERLYHALYHDSNDERDIKIIDVFVCKARKKLSEYGVEIKTHWGHGYFFDQASLDILKTWGLDPQEVAA